MKTTEVGAEGNGTVGRMPPLKGAVKFARVHCAGSGFRVDGDVKGLDAMAKLDEVYTQTGLNIWISKCYPYLS